MKFLNKVIAIGTLIAIYSPTFAQAYVDETHCMALNIYHEAKNQSFVGQVAVGLVTMNRVRDHRYPNTVCEVVYQGPSRPSWKDPNKRIPIRHKCQFSWYCDGKSDEARDKKAWWKAVEYARMVMSHRILDVTEGATHYHATYVRPAWASQKTRTTRIETHIFYRWEK
tara:strand:- start:194 stop:697 length:504 start_codon:yes stop_codon:yes gene_type:complete